ncbi:CWF19-like protein 2 isoform X2 [Cephus cinctus]|nr:CWF19-like protein 2 isoform X2 [Cephus cinctus]XP_015594630.1 CWF19-like protein 2 isoform X2 [Cephus cinctus]
MLPSLDAKLKLKKSKKEKKAKTRKEKKSKKKKKTHDKSSSGSGSTDDEKEEWVEKAVEHSIESTTGNVSETQKPVERDEWMNLPGLFPCTSRSELRQSKTELTENKQDSAILRHPGQSERELNPYWKDGGTGLPLTETEHPKSGRLMDAAWLKKSLQRAQEQATEEGKSLEEIAAERWGSLETIKSMIADAEAWSHNEYGSRKDKKFATTNDDNYYKKYDKRRIYGSNSRERRHRSRSRSSERQGPYRSQDGHYKSEECNNDRYEDRERRNKYREKYDNEYYERRQKPSFKKPNQDDNTVDRSSASSRSAGTKRWQKLEIQEMNKKEQSERIIKELEKEKLEKVESDSNGVDSESEQNSENEEDKVLTEAELNQLGARIVKAEIMGDNELAAELKIKLENAREIRKNAPVKPSKGAEQETVILTRTDNRGMSRPVEPRSQYQEPAGGRRKKKRVETHTSGERVRYFADDNKHSLQEMFQQEKGRSTAEDEASFANIASKGMDMDEMFEHKISHQESDAKKDARDRMRAIHEHKKMARSLDNCRWCVDSKEMLKHMIVAMGTKVYLSLPSHTSLTIGHCILSPIHHVICQTQLDEDIWEELQAFKKALTKMFKDQDEDPVFFEISMGHHRFPHMQLECIPLPKEVGDTAPIYFKKALLECEMEWSTNKKVVDLSGRDVRRAIPKGLPYFAVDFGMQGGFAHVIEDERLFPRNFAQEIIGGMLDLDHSLWRKPRRENFDTQRKKVMEFAEMWKKYDFTADNDSD